MERKLNEIFYVKKHKYKCVKDFNSCTLCVHRKKSLAECNSNIIRENYGECMKNIRQDGTNVIFMKYTLINRISYKLIQLLKKYLNI